MNTEHAGGVRFAEARLCGDPKLHTYGQCDRCLSSRSSEAISNAESFAQLVISSKWKSLTAATASTLRLKLPGAAESGEQSNF